MKINNNVLAAVIVIFIVFSIASTRVLLEKINTITGAPTVQSARVQLEIVKNVSAPVMGAGAGSGSAKKTQIGLRIEPSNFLVAYSISTFVAEVILRQIYIKNIGELSTSIELKSTLDIISFDKQRFKLGRDEEIAVNFKVNTLKPGLYTGKIMVISEFEVREIPVSITIRPNDRNFDLYAKVRGAQLKPGEDLIVDVDVKRLSGGSIELQYIIQDAANLAVMKVTETRKVTNSLSIAKVIRIPKNIKTGAYIFAVEAHYKGGSDIVSKPIKISKTKRILIEQPEELTAFSMLPLMFILLLLLLIIINVFLFKKKDKDSRL